MKITITFETDNAAFEDDFQGEIRHLLAQARDGIFAQLDGTEGCWKPEPGEHPLRDINGNKVGKVEVT